MKQTQLYCHLAASIIVAVSLSPLPAQTPGSSPTAPASTGITPMGIVECGQGYTSHELYDMKITQMTYSAHQGGAIVHGGAKRFVLR